MAVKIKLKRLGKIREPYYRIVVADARTKRDGRAIEEIGKYHPKADPSFIEVNSERAQHWLAVGAQPTDPVRKLLEITGDWQKFKGLPGTEGTLRTAAPRDDKKAAFAAALAETLTEGATTPKGRGKAPARAGDAKAGTAKAGTAKAGEAKAGEAKAGEAKAGEAKAGEAKAEKPAKGGKAGAKAEAAAGASEAADAAEPAKVAAPADAAVSAAAEDAGAPAAEAEAAVTADEPAESGGEA